MHSSHSRVVVIRLDYGLDGPGFESVLHTGSEAHPASYSIGTRAASRGLSGRGVELTINLHLVPRLRMSGAIPLLPYMPSWRGQGKVTSGQNVEFLSLKPGGA